MLILLMNCLYTLLQNFVCYSDELFICYAFKSFVCSSEERIFYIPYFRILFLLVTICLYTLTFKSFVCSSDELFIYSDLKNVVCSSDEPALAELYAKSHPAMFTQRFNRCPRLWRNPPARLLTPPSGHIYPILFFKAVMIKELLNELNERNRKKKILKEARNLDPIFAQTEFNSDKLTSGDVNLRHHFMFMKFRSSIYFSGFCYLDSRFQCSRNRIQRSLLKWAQQSGSIFK